METSVVSYAVAWPSRDVLVAARQQITSEWWRLRRHHFGVMVSEVVLSEAAQGNPEAAAKRMALLKGIQVLALTEDARLLARRLIRDGALPARALGDAIHVAVAAVNEIDYLLTWNCRHIDNAEKKPLIRSICALAGCRCPEICTPDELMGEKSHAG